MLRVTDMAKACDAIHDLCRNGLVMEIGSNWVISAGDYGNIYTAGQDAVGGGWRVWHIQQHHQAVD